MTPISTLPEGTLVGDRFLIYRDPQSRPYVHFNASYACREAVFVTMAFTLLRTHRMPAGPEDGLYDRSPILARLVLDHGFQMALNHWPAPLSSFPYLIEENDL